jgi:hypothetical protein
MRTYLALLGKSSFELVVVLGRDGTATCLPLQRTPHVDESQLGGEDDLTRGRVGSVALRYM